jgi:hypothetical protein
VLPADIGRAIAGVHQCHGGRTAPDHQPLGPVSDQPGQDRVDLVLASECRLRWFLSGSGWRLVSGLWGLAGAGGGEASGAEELRERRSENGGIRHVFLTLEDEALAGGECGHHRVGGELEELDRSSCRDQDRL